MRMAKKTNAMPTHIAIAEPPLTHVQLSVLNGQLWQQRQLDPGELAAQTPVILFGLSAMLTATSQPNQPTNQPTNRPVNLKLVATFCQPTEQPNVATSGDSRTCFDERF